jgi:formylglycine-generating enzyme required for sulfatase activity
MKKQLQRKLSVKGVHSISALLLGALLFSHIALAHESVKVVVVPLGGDEPPAVRPNSELFINSIGMEFSLIPAGSFVMGSPDGTGAPSSRPVNIAESGRGSDELQHIVNISKSFYMQTTEVTQAQYQQVMDSNPAHFSALGEGEDCGLDCPVENVNWNEAHAFIDALNASENRVSCNSQPNTCYSLPTESQWEYAARGATVSAFYNGDITEPSGNDTNLNLIGWYNTNSGSTTHPVAQKAANQWGLYDMSGNVWEWCEDLYAAYPDGPVTDPVSSTGSFRVFRGGSWGNGAGSARSANRDLTSAGLRSGNLGFRLVLPPAE